MSDQSANLTSLEGRTALVTGASRGIGEAVCRLFVAQGATVVANHEPATKLPRDLASHPRVLAVEADIGDPAAIHTMFAECERAGKSPSVLVNNAGAFPRMDPLEVEVEDWDAVLNLNLRGAFLCTQAAARSMLRHGPGQIVNISSDAAVKGPPNGAPYAASKAGLLGMTRSFARRLGPSGIRVNAIAPGVIDTAQSNLDVAARARKAEKAPLGRVGCVDDVARVALFLASPLSDYVTGHVIYVNGGSWLG